MNARLKDYFSENDYLRTDVAATLGDSRAILSRLVADGELQRIAQGVYALPDTLADELAVIAGRSKNIVFSHETALALHGLHNRHPPEPPVRSDPLHITLFVGRHQPVRLEFTHFLGVEVRRTRVNKG